jgi:hypothetical protein
LDELFQHRVTARESDSKDVNQSAVTVPPMSSAKRSLSAVLMKAEVKKV